jgi:hypothetical protein
MNEFIKGTIASLFASGLIAAGVWLAATRVPVETALQYSAIVHRVGSVSTALLILSNNSRYEFEKVVLKAPDEQILVSSLELSQGNQCTFSGSVVAARSGGWEGKLGRGQCLRALFVQDGTGTIFSEDILKELVLAEYQQRDDRTGGLIWERVPLRRGSTPTWQRVAWRAGWFMTPILGSGLLVVGIYFVPRLVRRIFRSGESRSPSPKAEDAGHPGPGG